MRKPSLEEFLARIYVDADARGRFLEDPIGEARRAGLDRDAAQQLGAIDRDGLELAAASFARKRKAKRGLDGLWRRLFGLSLT